MRNTDGTIRFDNRPRIISFASVVGKKEAQGPLRECFDRIVYDSYVGRNTFEQGESELMKIAMTIALGKADLASTDIGAAFCGDLLNQCVASSFAVNGQPIPYAGIYGACSTMALGLIPSAVTVESGAARRALCAASSHYCTAERQYRFPLEYGSQRPPTAQWTVTGSGACVLEQDSEQAKRDCRRASDLSDDRQHRHSPPKKPAVGDEPDRVIPNGDMPYIRAARLGVITDMGITDQNNMGAAMAPAIVKLGT